MMHSEVPMSELEALQELQKLGLPEIDGQSLDPLMRLAESRARALESLAAAREDFRRGLGGDEGRMKPAYEGVLVALKSLDGISYPENEAFAPRRDALESDRAQARALLAAIDTWWWRRFSQSIAEVYTNLKTPAQARASLDNAEKILAQWPVSEGSVRSGAKESLDKAAEEVNSLASRQFNALVDEAEAWIALGHQVGDSSQALECVVHAEASCKAAERLLDDIRSPAKQLSRNRLGETGKKLETARQQALEQLPGAVLQRRRDLVAQQLRQWQQDYLRVASTEDKDWNYLFTNTEENARSLRRRLDELSALMRLDPDYSPDEKMRDLIRRRERNLRRSAELLGEVQQLAKQRPKVTTETADASRDWLVAERYVYHIWCACEEAKRLDPDLGSDNQEIAGLLSSADQTWAQLREQIEASLNGSTNQQLQALMGQLNVFEQTQFDGLASIENHLREICKASEAAQTAIDELDRKLASYHKAPPQWDERLFDLRQHHQEQADRLRALDEGFQTVKKLVEAWKSPYDLSRLITRTEEICSSGALPSPIRQVAQKELLNSIREALPGIRNGRHSVARQIELTRLLRQLRNSVEAIQNVHEV